MEEQALGFSLSKESYPKQFLSLFNENEISLLNTGKIKNLKNLRNPILILMRSIDSLLRNKYDRLILFHFILEPFGRNTAPTIALAALFEIEKSYFVDIIFRPYYWKPKELLRVIYSGIEYANNGDFSHLSHSWFTRNGYGYIKSREPLDSQNIKDLKLNVL